MSVRSCGRRTLPVFYPRWEVHSGDILGWLAGAALIVLGAVLWFVQSRAGRGPLVGALFFALSLSPVLGFVDFRFMQIAFVADRFQYLAIIGPLAVLLGRRGPTAWIGSLSGAAPERWSSPAAVLAALGALSWRQSGIYRDDLTFARHAVALNPQNYLGQVLLSHGLNAAGRADEAPRRGLASG